MKSLLIFCTVALVVLSGSAVAARRLSLRPLSPQELRVAVLEAGLKQAPVRPQLERSIPSALAGLTGFALGVKSGIGGALLFDVLTSEQALNYLSDAFNNINNGNGNGNVDPDVDNGEYQEVCFNSRSLNGDLGELRNYEDEDYENEDQFDDEDFYDDEDNSQNRQLDGLAEPLTTVLAGSANAALTCLVVNSGGPPFLRHRRSLEFGQSPVVA